MSYSQRLLQQGNSLTRLAHRSRFDAVLNIISNQQYNQAIDYGCGDGWLLRTACERGIVTSGIGIDIEPQMLSACQNNFDKIPGFKFCHPQEMPTQIAPKSCDLVFCTETLEHVGNPEEVLNSILPYCQPRAKVVISVPIEVGPSLIFKQIGRYFANLKGNYGYERYQINELFSAAILWDASQFPSSHSIPTNHRAHKGFDYRKLSTILKEKINIEKQFFSPFPWLGNLLNSTVIFLGAVN